MARQECSEEMSKSKSQTKSSERVEVDLVVNDPKPSQNEPESKQEPKCECHFISVSCLQAQLYVLSTGLPVCYVYRFSFFVSTDSVLCYVCSFSFSVSQCVLILLVHISLLAFLCSSPQQLPPSPQVVPHQALLLSQHLR